MLRKNLLSKYHLKTFNLIKDIKEYERHTLICNKLKCKDSSLLYIFSTLLWIFHLLLLLFYLKKKKIVSALGIFKKGLWLDGNMKLGCTS